MSKDNYGEISQREQEAREVAPKCDTVRAFQTAMGFRHIETAIHWNDELKLGLPMSIDRPLVKVAGVPCPKPAPKSKGAPAK